MRERVPGIILIVTCQKYLTERVPHFIPGADSYEGWPVVYCLGDPNLSSDYVIANPGGKFGKKSMLYVKCEDTYVHLLKKFDLAARALETMYNIEQGILKIGDDIKISEQPLREFLKTKPKADYIGRTYSGEDFTINKAGFTCQESSSDSSMRNYFARNPHAVNEIRQLTGKHDWPFISGEVPVPRLPPFPPGMALYLSTKAIKAIHDEMDSIEFRVLDDYGETGYRYLIEDVAIAYILYTRGISYTNMSNFFQNSRTFDPSSLFTHTAIQGHYI
jgi:hypothetical protein